MQFPFRAVLGLVFPWSLAVASSGCVTAPPDADAPEAFGEVGAALTGSNCAHVPGCLEVLGASDGPFHVAVTTSRTEGGVERTLSVRYVEGPDRGFLLCHLFPRQPALSLVFVLGSAGGGAAVTLPMRVDCPTSYGDNSGLSNSATLWLKESDDPALWNTLFPARADGSRWYAVQLAAANAWGGWDSRYGQNYRLVLARP